MCRELSSTTMSESMSSGTTMSRTIAGSESPFPPSSSASGCGSIVARCEPGGGSGLASMTYQYPLKLISPPGTRSAVGGPSVVVFLLSYGGGLVGGDKVRLTVSVEPGARLVLLTQGHTKIFKSNTEVVVAAGVHGGQTDPDDDDMKDASSPGGRRAQEPSSVPPRIPLALQTRQVLEVSVGDGAGLCLLPDPVQPFAESVYGQKQVFTVSVRGGSVCVLDWVTQGRVARGEAWDCVRWSGLNEIWAVDNTVVTWDDQTSSRRRSSDERPRGPSRRLVVRDSVVLDRESMDCRLRPTMHGNAMCGTLLLYGPQCQTLARFFLDEFAALPRVGARGFPPRDCGADESADGRQHLAWREERWGMERANGVQWSVAQVRGSVVVKFVSQSVEAGRLWIGQMIQREGSVEREFGEEALTCLRA